DHGARLRDSQRPPEGGPRHRQRDPERPRRREGRPDGGDAGARADGDAGIQAVNALRLLPPLPPEGGEGRVRGATGATANSFVTLPGTPLTPSLSPLRGERVRGVPLLAGLFRAPPVVGTAVGFVTPLRGAGGAAVLPFSQSPPITPPTVQVTTTYPGASAKTLVETVALPIEQQVNGVEKML